MIGSICIVIVTSYLLWYAICWLYNKINPDKSLSFIWKSAIVIFILDVIIISILIGKAL